MRWPRSAREDSTFLADSLVEMIFFIHRHRDRLVSLPSQLVLNNTSIIIQVGCLRSGRFLLLGVTPLFSLVWPEHMHRRRGLRQKR